MKWSIIICTILFSVNAIAQQSFQSYKNQTRKLIPDKSIYRPDYSPTLISKPYNPTFATSTEIDSVFIAPNNSISSEISKDSEIVLPQIIAGFEDAYDAYSVPNDNTIAVSNDGFIVSMRNSKISFYDSENQLILTQSLEAFTDELGISGDKYDPRVIYDQDQNRFVTVILSGFDYLSSQIIIGFSSSSDPSEEWNFYSISGNILDDATWSDFPIIALSNEELFVTVTNFADMTSNDTWDFYGCRIIQMNKFQGYGGEELVDYTYHTVNPGFGMEIPSTIYYYNVAPVRGGLNLYGPHMYFISTLDCPEKDEVSGEWPANDTVFLVKFSGTQDDPDFEISSTFLQSNILYGLSEKTPQPSGHNLQTGYNTVKDAIFENDIIHFTLNSIDYNNSKAGILHGTITNPETDKSLFCTMISSDTMGIAYPAIAYIGENEEDQKLIIAFNYASETLWPGNACLIYDNGLYSDYKVLKQGEGVMNMTSSNAERWGDYATIQVKYNEPDLIFFVGSYGKLGKTRSWITKMTMDPDYTQTATNTMLTQYLDAFPNPASEIINILFTTDSFQICDFTILDLSGKVIDNVFIHRVKAGENMFSFNVSHLPAGTYILQITGSNEYFSSQKFVVK